MSATDRLVVRIADLESFPYPTEKPVYMSRGVFDRDGVGSPDLTLSCSDLKAGTSMRGTCHPAGCNEGYFALRGRARLTLGGDPRNGEGGQTYEIGPDTAVFIPGGLFHRLDNPYDEDFVLLTIWPQPPAAGANRLYDERRKAWGSDFRKKRESPDHPGAP